MRSLQGTTFNKIRSNCSVSYTFATDQDKQHSTGTHLTLRVASWQQKGARWWGEQA